MVALCLLGFWATMIFSQLAFKLADHHPSYRIIIFLIGASIGLGGTWFMVLLHARMQPHLVVGLCIGVGFVLSQVAMSILERQYSPWALLGSLIVAIGIMTIAYASAPVRETHELPLSTPVSTATSQLPG